MGMGKLRSTGTLFSKKVGNITDLILVGFFMAGKGGSEKGKRVNISFSRELSVVSEGNYGLEEEYEQKRDCFNSSIGNDFSSTA